MSKEDVKNNILHSYRNVPYITAPHEFAPNRLACRSLHIGGGGMAVFRFENDKLVEVAECFMLGSLDNLIELCYSFGLATEVEIVTTDFGQELTRDYVWNNGKIEFNLCKIDNLPSWGTRANTSSYYGIVYRKL